MPIPVGILVIGSELVNGYVIDSNSTVIAKTLTEAGYQCRLIVKVGDHVDEIVDGLSFLSSKVKAVIITGGLGSTHDDLTREALAKYLAVELRMDNKLKKIILKHQPAGEFSQESFLKQAQLPAGSKPILSSQGVAPGIFARKAEILYFALPGVPSEMREMLVAVKDELNKHFKVSLMPVTRQFIICGLSEPEVAYKLKPVQESFRQAEFIISASQKVISITVVVDKFQDMIKIDSKLTDCFGSQLVSNRGKKLEIVVGEMLRREKQFLAMAESCTGGLLSKRITDVPGSSDYFLGSIISYSNQAKEELLGVRPQTLKKYGAVSKETALEMARGAKSALEADIAVSVTGIAGPSGGSKDKPVGLVYIAIASDSREIVKKFYFSGDRSSIRQQSSTVCLDLLRLEIARFASRSSSLTN